MTELDSSKTYLVTGAAGFIGFYLAKRLLEQGCNVIGIDNVNVRQRGRFFLAHR